MNSPFVFGPAQGASAKDHQFTQSQRDAPTIEQAARQEPLEHAGIARDRSEK
jgi:hypothetical protein